MLWYFVHAAKNKQIHKTQKSRCADLNAEISRMGNKLVLKRSNPQEIERGI